MGECIFCQIARGERPAEKLYEDGRFLAFLDIYPANPGHTLVIPRTHCRSLTEMPEEEVADYFRVVVRLAGLVKKAVDAQGFNLGVNDGSAAGQVIPHVHVHIIPRYRLDRGMGIQGIVRAPAKVGELKEITSKIWVEVAHGSTPTLSLKGEGWEGVRADRWILRAYRENDGRGWVEL